MGSGIRLLLMTLLALSHITAVVAQTKKDQIRYTSVVRAKDDWTENSFSVDATKKNGTNEQVTFTGKVYSYYNPTTQKKDLGGGGFVRGDKVEITENADQSLKLNFIDRTGSHKITLNDNKNGELSRGQYTYGNSGDTLKFIGDATGKVTATVSYTTANLNGVAGMSWTGGVTVQGNILTGVFDQITAASNISYHLDGTGTPTYNFGVANTYNLSSYDDTIWITFGISW